MTRTLEIGDRSQDGLLEIADTRWDYNGTMFVTVRELIGHKCWNISDDKLIAKMRRFARRALSHPEKTRSSRIVNRHYDGTCDYVTFAVSRLPRD